MILSKKPDQRIIQKTELMIAYLLRGGVILSAIIIVWGIILTWLSPHLLHDFSTNLLPILTSGKIVSYSHIPKTISELFIGLVVLDPTAVTTLGLLVLIALPVLRVGLTVFAFILEQDYIYVMITLFVLSILVTGIVLGKGL